MDQRVSAALVATPTGDRAKVFISYSRKDSDFAQMLSAALAERGFDAFLDKTDIAPGEPWKERLAGLIAAADTIVFIVSPDSIGSTICTWELQEGERLSKRVIPVVARRIADTDAPPTLSRLNWVFLADGDDKDAALATLNTALFTDLAWVREHTRIGELARHWDMQGRGKGANLRGAELEAAERWLDRRPANANAPTNLHQDFIRASRRAATARQRYWVGGSLVVALVAIALAAFAEISRRQAETQRERAERTLTLATATTNSLVFDLAKKFRYAAGMQASMIKDILDRALRLQDQLLGAGEANPDLRRSRADALMETVDTLLTLGETQSALTLAQQAQKTFQALLLKQPNSTVFQDELSLSYARVGDVLLAQGNLPEALKSYQMRVVIMEGLAKADPGNADWQRDLAAAYNNIGDVLEVQGELPDALKSYQAGLAIAERLAKVDPSNIGRQHDLAVADERVGNVLVAQDDLPEALKFYQAQLAILDRLAKAEPNDAGWQSDLAMPYNKIGGILERQGNLQEALKSYQASFAIRDRLAQTDPGNAGWQQNLAASHDRVGNVQAAQSNLRHALKSYQASFNIMEHLVMIDPSNTGWQGDLAASYSKVGKVLKLQGNLPEALKSYRAGLAIVERLAKAEPGNIRWQVSLPIFYNSIGDLQVQQDNLPDALKSYLACVAIRERLVRTDRRNTDWRNDLAVSYAGLASVHLKLGDTAEALATLRKGRDIMAGMSGTVGFTWLVGEMEQLEAEAQKGKESRPANPPALAK